MFTNLKADLKRYEKFSLYLLFEQGIWAMVVYRYGRWIRGVRIPILNILFKISAFVLFKGIEILTGISLPASADIGKGFLIGHFGNIIVHSQAKIGEHCSVGPGVLIGTRGLGNNAVPVIGNDVYIGVGAKILGAVHVGDHVRIGANAVVLSDIPDGATAVGIPAKIIRKP